MATPAEEQERTISFCKALAALLSDKNANYKRNLQRHGMRGIVIRMSDKMMRLENMVLAAAPDAVNEPLQDTLLDIAGYAIRSLVLMSFDDLTLAGEWAEANGVYAGVPDNVVPLRPVAE